ncbi:9346_t:CDS:2, partial [Entrophospora sp. SA101]
MSNEAQQKKGSNQPVKILDKVLILLQVMGTIKSSRIFGKSKVRYSFISTDGGEMIDISDTIEDILGDVDVLVVEEE